MLRFSFDTQIVGEFGDNLDDDFDLENSTIIGLYTREGANASLSFSARYTEIELDETVALLADVGSTIIDQGTLARFGLDAGVVFGRDGPFEVSLNAAYRDLNYQDTTDLTLSDEEQFSFDALARLRLNSAITLRGLAGYRDTDEEDLLETEREFSFFGLGLETETASGLQIVGDVLFDHSETTTNAPSEVTEEGLGGELAITQLRPNGTIGFVLSSRIDESGRRSLARVTRSLDTPTGGLSFSLGVVNQADSDDLEFIGGLGYSRELPRGTLVANLTQEASSRDGDAFLNTSISVDYSQIINSVSGWQAELAYVSSEELGGADDDSRASAVLSYTRELTEDWNMRAGVEFIRDIQENAANTNSNTVFFNIERDITFGF
ncbi:hypothetical protein N9L47_07745 [Rhodobacteraceae bacterium]|nr:hypothetical protein [Paracoccaceae bacterium]